jgi:hypothetical protein
MTQPKSPREAALATPRRAIGRRVDYAGSRCVIHDVLDDPPLLVLKRLDELAPIQPDAFGKPARRAPALVEIPVFGPGGEDPSEELARIRFDETRQTR